MQRLADLVGKIRAIETCLVIRNHPLDMESVWVVPFTHSATAAHLYLQAFIYPVLKIDGILKLHWTQAGSQTLSKLASLLRSGNHKGPPSKVWNSSQLTLN